MYEILVGFPWQEHDWKDGATVVVDSSARKLRLEPGLSPDTGVVWGLVRDNLATTGWIELQLEASSMESYSNDLRAYCAGFLEGLMTSARLSQFYMNLYGVAIKDEATSAAYKNVRLTFKGVIEHVTRNTNLRNGQITGAPLDPYWVHQRINYVQMWGIKEGYNFAALAKGLRQLDMTDMFVINSHAELPEMMQAYTPEAAEHRQQWQAHQLTFLQQGQRTSLRGKHRPLIREKRVAAEPERRQLKPPAAALEVPLAHAHAENRLNSSALIAADRDWENRLARDGHCSALVRVSAMNKDLFVGHTTWSDYSKMTRLWKHYNLHFPGSWQASSKISFSSYPGCISSTDDYYMLSAGLVVMDTSLEILNERIYDRIPEFPSNAYVPTFLHVMAVNRMAQSGPHWVSLFSEKNAGIGSAQWLIVNYNRFVPETELQSELFFVLEQVPGITRWKDMTHVLRMEGFFASYNRPYFADVRDTTGHTAAEAKYGDLYSWSRNPRGIIFSRIAPAIRLLSDMRAVMTRNNFPHEGTLPNEPGHAISARLDLDPVNHIPNGGIDAKVTNKCLFHAFTCQAISGPTHTEQPIFQWNDGSKEFYPGWPHLGLPSRWDFEFVQVTPSIMTTDLHDVEKC